MDRDEWIHNLFRRVDAKDCEGWLEFLAPDARFRFGNSAIVEGKDAIRGTITAFFDGISALRHEIVETWEQPETIICRGDVTYTRLDGSTLRIPFLNVFKLDGVLIRDYLVYADASELHSGRPR